jgi:hypothetical protein
MAWPIYVLLGLLLAILLSELPVRWCPSSWRWYRRWRGGTWYLVAPWPHLPYIEPFWTRRPIASERLLDSEDWP